jgi:hypothetical protein
VVGCRLALKEKPNIIEISYGNIHFGDDYMVIILIIFMFFVISGLISIDTSLKKKLKNDKIIIEKLDLIVNKDSKESR